MIGFAFFFAPTAFHYIGNLSLFAALIAQTLRAIDIAGFIGGAILIALLVLTPRTRNSLVRQACVIGMLAATAFEHWLVIPHMEYALSALHGTLTQLAPTAPARAAYDALHRESSSIYSITLLLGIIALSLRAVADRRTVEDARTAHAGEC